MSEPLVLGGRYQVGQQLGSGGMATVYAGVDLKLQRPVAIKLLRPHLAGDPLVAQRFGQEARSVASVTHPNVAAVLDGGTDGDRQYIIMELVSGPTLAQRLASSPSGRLPAEEAMRIASDVARALGAAHARGMVHRDIKPANILFTPSGQVKVTDFGIARAFAENQATEAGAILGSPSYLSPEQARGEAAVPASDIYSLGVLLYHMLAGRPPYTGESPLAIALQHLQGTPPPLSALAPDLPTGLAAVVSKAMSKQASDRFGSAAEFADALADVQAGRPLSFGPPRVSAPVAHDPDSTMVLSAEQMRGAASAADAVQAGAPTERLAPPADRAGRTLWWVVGLLLAVTALAAGIYFAPRKTPAAPPTTPAPPLPRTVVVRDLVGKDLKAEEAAWAAECAQQGLRAPQVWEMGQEDSGLAKGQVVRQEPAPLSTVAEGGVVRVWTSTGIARVRVPDVSGMSPDIARQTLVAAQLVVGDISTRFDAKVAEGLVADQKPAAGSDERVGTTVGLIVSKGPEPAPPPPPPPAPAATVDVTHGPMEQLDGGQLQTTVNVDIQGGSAAAQVELEWLSGGTGSPGGGSVPPGQTFSQTVRGEPGAQLAVKVNGEQAGLVTFSAGE